MKPKLSPIGKHARQNARYMQQSAVECAIVEGACHLLEVAKWYGAGELVEGENKDCPASYLIDFLHTYCGYSKETKNDQA